MKTITRNPAIRQGQFLWMDSECKENYLKNLKQKISDGFYFSDRVISKIVEEIAPALEDTVEY